MGRAIASATFQCGWVVEPEKGDPGVNVVVSPNVIVATNGKLDNETVYVDLYVGEERVAPDSVGMLTSAKADVEHGLVWDFINSSSVSPQRFGYRLNAVSLKKEFTASSKVTYNGKEYPFELPFRIVNDGVGIPGPAGPFTDPPHEWDDHPWNQLFYDGSGGSSRTAVYHGVQKDTNLKYVYFCKKTHAKSADTEPGTDGGEEYWGRAQGPYHVVATDILLAMNAVIKFLSGQAIRLYDDRGTSVTGEIMGGNGILAWLGGTASNPMWAVDAQGLQTLGGRTGQRIELSPAEKAMRIFDASGNICGVHSGRSIGANPVPSVGSNTSSEQSLTSGTKQQSGHVEMGTDQYASTYPVATLDGLAIPVGGLTSVTVPKVYYEMRTVGSSIPDAARVTLQPLVEVYNGTQLVNTFDMEGISHSGAGTKTLTYPSRTFYVEDKAVTKVVLKVKCDVINTAALSGEFKWSPSASTEKLNVSFKIKRYRCEFGSDGMVISFDNNNYFYLRHDGSKLVGKFVSNGTTVFSS
ncbi:MAG: hypothetical protein K2F87_00135 [Muribaculaceae bacterium]|nr:hypothetical protein [Muribaculaceae bacterium]